ncbi:peroxisomal membrane protein 11C-like [Diadema setosum]|uniref:peroxisomal membrane protein 11C-like n=1 Tax=Diadema setosum TaxID=31175 RepID=UPI003B3AEBB1
MAASKHAVFAAAKFLQGYSERDKVMRTLSYVSLLIAGLSKRPSTARKFSTITGQLSLCRTILRLFDDIPMLAHTLSYGWGRQERSSLMQVIGVLQNIVNQLFFPIEHIAWAADNKLIDIPAGRWWTLSVTAWLTALCLGIIKSSGTLLELQEQKRMGLKQEKSSHGGHSREAVQLAKQQTAVLLRILADASDLCNAVNWMPEGFLWANKLPNRWIGLFGTISSLIKLGLVVQSKR